MKTIKLGSNVVVSDPCYEIGTWCQAQIQNVLPGDYKATAEVLSDNETRGWGQRISALGAVHKDYVRNDEIRWELSDYDIGVDSGQAGIFDLESYRNDRVESPILENTRSMFGPDESEGDLWYTKMCTLTGDTDDDFGVYESGAVSSSGYGDGSYDLYLGKNKEGNVVGFVIDYGINSNGVSFPDFYFETNGYEGDDFYEDEDDIYLDEEEDERLPI